MQHVIVQKSVGPEAGYAGSHVGQLVKWIVRLRTAMLVARERRALLQLDDRMLKDIGIGRSEAYSEALKPFSDLPPRRTHR